MSTFYRAKAALLAAKPHWRSGPWKSDWDNSIDRYIEIAELDIQYRDTRSRTLNEREKGLVIHVTRNQWQGYHEYWYQIVRKIVAQEDSRKFFEGLKN